MTAAPRMDARAVALQALIACHRQGAWSDSMLQSLLPRAGLDRRDAALASRLCYSVLQNELLLDWQLARFTKLDRLQPVILEILRLAACQLLLLDKIPPSAAVNEAVKQAKRYANPGAAGLVNGVLRNLLRALPLPEPEDLATRYSHPAPLVALLREACNSDAELEALLACDNTPAPLYLQCNTVRTTAQALQAQLEEAGIACQAHPWLPDCLTVTGAGDLAALASYQAGLFYVQDPAAKLAVLCAGLRPGMRVLDCCAAPGGKSFAAAIAMENTGSITSCDIHEKKANRITQGAARMGLSAISARALDARAPQPDWRGQMDAVLCDVPCSGLGVIRKKPDIRYKDLAQTVRLPLLQRAILENQAPYVRPGGVLLYSTCTILPRENAGVMAAFLADHPEFFPEPLALPAGIAEDAPGMVTLLPHKHGTDGFYICKLRRAL